MVVKILLIEDDAVTAGHLRKGLSEHGHSVDHAAQGREGLIQAAGGEYDVLVVDRMLPGMDGLAIVKTIRAAGVKTPVLFLTTMNGIDDRVEGLEAGGDDYLVKPFAFAELLARIHALARRPPLSPLETVLRVADLEMDLLKRTVKRGARSRGGGGPARSAGQGAPPAASISSRRNSSCSSTSCATPGAS